MPIPPLDSDDDDDEVPVMETSIKLPRAVVFTMSWLLLILLYVNPPGHRQSICMRSNTLNVISTTISYRPQCTPLRIEYVIAKLLHLHIDGNKTHLSLLLFRTA